MEQQTDRCRNCGRPAEEHETCYQNYTDYACRHEGTVVSCCFDTFLEPDRKRGPATDRLLEAARETLAHLEGGIHVGCIRALRAAIAEVEKQP